MIDYTAYESLYEHKDKPHQKPLICTRLGRINQVDRLSLIIY